jgi:hypothetical protein
MSPDRSRRNFLKFAPGAIALFSMAETALAQNPPPPPSGTGATSSNPRPPGGGGGYGGGMATGPAAHDGDYQPGRVGGAHEHDKVETPLKPRKNLAADQRSMREDVQQLVRDTQELKKALEGFGPKQQLSAEMIGKTKQIEKLAHDIAELAKG